MLKIYKTFDPESDICIWIYEDKKVKTIHTIIGGHNNCNELNIFCGTGLKHDEYPIISNIKKDIVLNLINQVYCHYDKGFKI